MLNLCRKPAARQNPERRVTAVKIIPQKKTVKMIQQSHAMMIAVLPVLPALLLLKPLFQKTCVWNFLITKRIRILSFNIQTLIFPTV